MKRIMFALIIAAAFSSCGGDEDECYKCSKDSYYNGIDYTDPGPYSWDCPEDGESTEAYEARISEKMSNGYTCKKE